MLYKVNTNELHWVNVSYTVEADSKEEAIDLVESGEGTVEWCDYDCTDQIDIVDVEKIENNEANQT